MRYFRDTTSKLLPFRAQSFLPQDTQQIELFRQEQLHRQWAIETQLHQTLGTVAAETVGEVRPNAIPLPFPIGLEVFCGPGAPSTGVGLSPTFVCGVVETSTKSDKLSPVS